MNHTLLFVQLTREYYLAQEAILHAFRTVG